MIQENILDLVDYGLATGLVEPADKVYTINRLLELFGVDEISDEVFFAQEKKQPLTQESAEAALEGILDEMMTYAQRHKNATIKELIEYFDTLADGRDPVEDLDAGENEWLDED